MHTLADRPRSQRILIGFGGLLGVAVVLWFFVVSPPLKQCTELRLALSNNDRSVVSEQLVAARLANVKASNAALDERLDRARSHLTDKSRIDDLLQNISKSAQEAGLDLKLFQRKEEVLGNFYAEIPVSVSVAGSFHDVATFFDTVNHVPGLVTIDRLSFSNPRQSEDRIVLQVDCEMTAHRLVTAEERDQSASSKEAREG